MDEQNLNTVSGGADTDTYHTEPTTVPDGEIYTSSSPQSAPSYTPPPASQPTYSQPAYTPPPFGTQPAYPQDYPTGMATASLVIGIISFLIGLFIFALPIPLLILPIIGIILGCVYKSKHYPVGKGSSTAGIVLSALTVVFVILGYVLIVAFLPQMLEYLEMTDPAMYDSFMEGFEAGMQASGY
jgi:hypothetical protein